MALLCFLYYLSHPRQQKRFVFQHKVVSSTGTLIAPLSILHFFWKINSPVNGQQPESVYRFYQVTSIRSRQRIAQCVGPLAQYTFTASILVRILVIRIRSKRTFPITVVLPREKAKIGIAFHLRHITGTRILTRHTASVCCQKMRILLHQPQRKSRIMITCSHKKAHTFSLRVRMQYILYFLLIEELPVIG